MIGRARLRCLPKTPATNAQGAALLLVMWLIALLTALVGAFALTARIENLQGRVLSQGVVAEQAARAGLEYAMVRVVDPEPTRQWLPDGRPYQWRFGDAAITVKIVDETGKVDLNAAEQPLLNALFRTVGAEPDLAASVASAIIDWRDPDPLSQPQGGAEDPQYAAAGRPYGAKDAPFDTVAEVEQVLGMTPALYAKVAEHLTVYSGQAQPDQTYASARSAAGDGRGPDSDPAAAQRNSASPDSSPSWAPAAARIVSTAARGSRTAAKRRCGSWFAREPVACRVRLIRRCVGRKELRRDDAC